MSIYIYNPATPQAVPVQPFPDITATMPEGLRTITDPVTRGRCGNCAACPKYWVMTVPGGAGGPTVDEPYAGKVYLEKQPYTKQLNQSHFTAGLCHWAQTGSSRISDANHERGPFHDGWHLVFNQGQVGNTAALEYRWELYTPMEVQLARSVYKAVNGPHVFSCLSPQSFTFYSSYGEFAFPWSYDLLTLTPIYW